LDIVIPSPRTEDNVRNAQAALSSGIAAFRAEQAKRRTYGHKQKLEALQSWISWITFQSKKKGTKKTLSR
jgi:hypothetical protein